MLTAGDVMTTDLITIPFDATTEEAVHTLLLHGVSGAPVVDELGRLRGIVSEFQLLVVVYNQEAKDEPVASFMTTDVICVDESDPLTEVANRMVAHRIRRLPVLRDGRLAGVVSRPDLLRYAIEGAVPLAPYSLLATA